MVQAFLVVNARHTRIARVARARRFDARSPVPFRCECGDLDCVEFVPMTLEHYDVLVRGGGHLIAEGHAILAAQYG